MKVGCLIEIDITVMLKRFSLCVERAVVNAVKAIKQLLPTAPCELSMVSPEFY
jgi:hypothetical protein